MKKLILIFALLLSALPFVNAAADFFYDDFETNSIQSSKWVATGGTPTTQSSAVKEGTYAAQLDQTPSEDAMNATNLTKLLNNRSVVSFWIKIDTTTFDDDFAFGTISDALSTCFLSNAGYPTSNSWGWYNNAVWTDTGVSSNSGIANAANNWINVRMVIDNIDQRVNVWMGREGNMTRVFANVTPACNSPSFRIRAAGGSPNVYLDNVTTCGYDNYGINCTPPAPAPPDTTPPSIKYYNLTSSGNGCENWNTDKTNACSTSSVLPSLVFNTSEAAYCAISGNFSSTSGMNYSDMGSARNCTGAASGEGATSHLCTLVSQDELVYDTSYLYVSCKDTSGNQNSTSTSGPLKASITGLEDAGRTSIGIGIQDALLSGYTNYTDQQIYARNLSNGQVRGTFDRAVKKSNKMWAINRIGVSDSYVNMFNLTPVLYTLEITNRTSLNITKQVELLINATK